MLEWSVPIRKGRILASHDEATYRSGEVSPYRWMFEKTMPFYNKGRGRSIMLSSFIVQHDKCEMFELSEEEFENALKHNPRLLTSDNQINYYPFSANAWIYPKKDNYFNNDAILEQFERFFILLKYKEAFKGDSLYLNIIIIKINIAI